MLQDAERELIRCICCTSTPAVFRVASAPVLMGEKMMTVMTVMMQAGKRQCLQLLSSYWGWQSTCDRLKYISHLSHLINTPIYSCSCFLSPPPRVPPTDFLPSLSLFSHIMVHNLHHSFTVQMEKTGWQFQFDRNPVCTKSVDTGPWLLLPRCVEQYVHIVPYSSLQITMERSMLQPALPPGGGHTILIS